MFAMESTREKMSAPPEPQNDTTMEEILASIRKIISEDQPESASPKLASGRAEAVRAEILELTEEVSAGDNRPADYGASDGNHAESREPVLSDSSRQAIERAFETLDEASTQFSSFAGGMLETVFARAVQDGVSSSLQQWVNGHEPELIDSLKPMVRDWMDSHLPRLVENVLKQELGRAVTEHLRRRLA
jgi:hypothetical protein